MPRFTFHYGSILISVLVVADDVVYLFTFHYGSILINSVSFLKSLIKFTFHYGSILIFSGNTCFNSAIIIYIPLWFYSNATLSGCMFCACTIYIPLWFYSNTIAREYSALTAEFTFHYGSILMKIYKTLLICLIYLHSTMVLF